MMEAMQLVGTEYISKALLKKLGSNDRIYWDDVPTALRIAEEHVRGHGSAADKGRIISEECRERYLTWQGCGRAIYYNTLEMRNAYNPFLFPLPLFRPCDRKADASGFCEPHKTKAIEDGRLPKKNLLERTIERLKGRE